VHDVAIVRDQVEPILSPRRNASAAKGTATRSHFDEKAGRAASVAHEKIEQTRRGRGDDGLFG